MEGKKLIKNAAIAVLLSIFYFVLNYYIDRKWITDNIPEFLTIKSTVSVNYNVGMNYDCGLGIFELSKSTVVAIRNDGISLLNENIYPRKNTGTNRNSEYKKWQETPMPESWGAEGGIFPMWCNSAFLNKELVSKLESELAEKGSYYTQGGYAGGYTMFVLPKSGMLIVKLWIM